MSQPTTAAATPPPEATPAGPLVSLRDFNLGFQTPDGLKQVLFNINVDVAPGEIVGLVGESGSGKTVTAKFVLGVLPQRTARVISGSAQLLGLDLIAASRTERERLKRHIAYVPQDPMAALNPSFKIVTQMTDVIVWDWAGQRLGRYLRMRRQPSVKRRARDLAAELLDKVKITNTATALDSYPVQLSGGMRQRVLLALSMAGRPKLLIADEPTTALDVTVQKRTIELMQDLVERENLSGLYITHDLGVARWLCRRSYVMLRGHIVEEGPTGAILDAPRAEYTRNLVDAVPRIDEPVAERELPPPLPSGRPQVRARELCKTFGKVQAVKSVSFDVQHGETFAIVGESGSGKSTIAQMMTGLLAPTSGEIRLDGQTVTISNPRDRLRYRDLIQMVFQDPASSLNPRQMLESIIGLPLKLRGMRDAKERRDKVVDLLDKVSLPPDFLYRRPVSLSGGQKQRVSIARALAVSPKVLVLDEPTSALDVSVQARILDLLKDLRARENLTYVVISHDLGVIRTLADRVAVMYHGDFLEVGTVNEIFENPKTDYTRTLIDAVPAL